MFISIVSFPFISCMELKWSWSPQKFKIYFIFVIWPVCNEPPQWTRCNPSLANEAHPVVARHPGTSFPVHHPQEAVSKSTNGSLFPTLPWFSPFQDPYKQESGWWHYIFPCVPGLEFKNTQWCFTYFTYFTKIHWNCWEDPTGCFYS